MKITIGKFDIEEYNFESGLKEICITINSGESQSESGLFSVQKLEEVISQFYNDNF